MLTDNPAIVLSHISLVYNSINKDKDVLVLTGDTHGGQIFLPEFIWKIIKRKPDVEHKYGLYQNKKKIIIRYKRNWYIRNTLSTWRTTGSRIIRIYGVTKY